MFVGLPAIQVGKSHTVIFALLGNFKSALRLAQQKALDIIYYDERDRDDPIYLYRSTLQGNQTLLRPGL